MKKNCTKYFPGWNAVYFIVSGIFIVWYSIEISVFSSCVYVRQWNTEFKLRFSFFHFRFVLPELITLRYLYACTITNYTMKWLSRLHYKIKKIQYKAGPWESRRTRLHQSLVFFFPRTHHPWFPGFLLSTASAFILPVQVKSGSEKRLNFVSQYHLTKTKDY